MPRTIVHIVLLSQYFHPEIGATQNRMVSFAHRLKEAGHSVTVICEFPNHPQGIIEPRYRGRWIVHEQWRGLQVVRVFVLASPRKTFLRRIAFYASFGVMSFVAGLQVKPRVKCVLATSPPIFTAAAGWLLAVARGALFVMDVRDLWPAAAVALGQLKKSWAVGLAQALERFLYCRADLILAVTLSFLKTISAHPGAAPVVHVPNGTDPRLFGPQRADPSFRESLGLDGKFVICFAGNLGLAQDLETVIKAAALLRTHQEIAFLLLGDGPARQGLVRLAAELQADNVVFHPQVPLTQAACWLASADLLLATLNRDPVFASFLPSKLFDYMASGRPILSNIPGEAEAIIRDSGAGATLRSSSPESMAAAIISLSQNPESLRLMGWRGRKFVKQHFDRRRIADAMAQQLERFVLSSRKSQK